MEKITEPAPLVERLKAAAQAWVDANDASLARLGRLVMNDNGFFSRIDSNPVTTTATLERFARYLADAENWPEGKVPAEVGAFLHVTGVTAIPEQTPTGQTSEMSGEFREAGEAA
jgi:hypothetical protein